MKKKEDGNESVWEWLFSDREFEDGETYDLHWVLNNRTGEVKMLVTKRIEVTENKIEKIVRE